MARGGGGGGGGGHSGSHSSGHSHSGGGHSYTSHAFHGGHYRRVSYHKKKGYGANYISTDPVEDTVMNGIMFSVIMIMVWLGVMSIAWEVNPSTIRRQPIAVPENELENPDQDAGRIPGGNWSQRGIWYLDYGNEGGWIKNSHTLLDGMEYFYEKTGVRPFLYITTDIDGNMQPSIEQFEAELEKLYYSRYSDGRHIVVGFLEGIKNKYVSACYAGNEAISVMDPEAREILLDELDYYYTDKDLTDDEYFSKSFQDAADRIMEPSFSATALPGSLLIGAAFCAVMGISQILYLYHKVRKERRLLENGTAMTFTPEQTREFEKMKSAGGNVVIIKGISYAQDGKIIRTKFVRKDIFWIILFWIVVPVAVSLIRFAMLYAGLVSPIPKTMPAYADITEDEKNDPSVFAIGGTTLTFPCGARQLETAGLKLSFNEAAVSPGTTIHSSSEDGITVSIKNTSDTECDIEDCMTTDFSVDAGSSPDEIGIQAPGDIRMLMSSDSDITKIFGKPDSETDDGTLVYKIKGNAYDTDSGENVPLKLSFHVDPDYKIADGFQITAE